MTHRKRLGFTGIGSSLLFARDGIVQRVGRGDIRMAMVGGGDLDCK